MFKKALDEAVDFISGSNASCAPMMTPIGGDQAPPLISGGVSAAPKVTGFGDSLPPTGDALPITADPDLPASREPVKLSDKNPGAFDKSDNDAQRVLRPDIVDGLRFEHNKMLGQQFSVSHSLWLGSGLLPTGNNYTFGSTLVFGEGRTLLVGRVSDDMKVDAQWHQEIIQPQRLVSRVIGSLGANAAQNISHATLEANGDTFCLQGKLAKGPMYALSYFQRVSDNVAVGAEAFVNQGHGQAHAFGKVKLTSSDKKDQMNATISTMGGCGANYVRKVTDRVSLAAEIEYSGEHNATHCGVGYEFLLRTSKISGVISTNGVVQTQIMEAIAPGFNIVFNGILDHKRNSHRFGYGINIG